MTLASPQTVYANTTLDSPLHNTIRSAVVAAYGNEFNVRKPIDPFLVESIVSGVASSLTAQAEQDADTPRERAYEAIDTEREYQNSGFGNASASSVREVAGPGMSLEGCILTIEELAAVTRRVWYRPEGSRAALNNLRKIAGVAVQAMERFGAPKREFTPQQQRVLQLRDAASSIMNSIFRPADATRAATGETAKAA